MMATPHLLAGAALGRALRRPWLVYPAALASHLLLDMVPHLDSHSLLGSGHGAPTRAEAALGVADFLLGAALIAMLARRQPGRRVIAGGALFALLIDLIEYVPPVGPWFRQWPAAAGWIHFHHGIQNNLTPAQWPLGMGTQLLVAAGAIAVYLRRARATIAARMPS